MDYKVVYFSTLGVQRFKKHREEKNGGVKFRYQNGVQNIK